MKNYQVKKDTDGWTVWSYGKCLGRFFRKVDGSGYKVVGGRLHRWKDDAIDEVVNGEDYQIIGGCLNGS